jgi:HSP20 family protein
MADIVRFDPIREMSHLREAMDRFFDREFFRRFDGGSWFEGDLRGFDLDLYETENELILEASLPGLKVEEVDVSIVGNRLTIKGEMKREEEKKEEDKYFYRERRYGAFHRALTLPVEVNPNKVEAVFNQGVLKLTMPKLEAIKPKHIEVKAK